MPRSHRADPGAGPAAGPAAVALDATCLRRWPLPYDAAGDKHARGTVLVIGGSPRTVGAVVLSGLAALRAGAGRLQLAVAQPAALAVGVAVPEALVAELPVHADGRLRPRRAIERLGPLIEAADAVLVGPGLVSDDATGRFLREVVGHIGTDTVLVVDAAAATAVDALDDVLAPAAGRLVIVANHREVDRLVHRARIEGSAPPGTDDLHVLAGRHGAVVVSFGDVVADDGRRWRCTEGSAGLGTSGSGDVLAGIAAGMAARCGRADQAACWATYAHAATGRRLSADVHLVGFLAREIADGVPATLRSVEQGDAERPDAAGQSSAGGRSVEPSSMPSSASIGTGRANQCP